ncbi:conserved hypothetical protein [Leishmania braziliensis MHOM/BR/75/M2904]|uniref:Uncharacterized protein n=2 Tax=Leishmania braziliensis TaxID=5660 RepID=E9AIC3_LEIBR|nr:conserved hypothetical protein [Leishmania braziliensis MHOM/BR/75/M2904]KAI5686741.1 hypothetical protein MNV84_03392 [Leishmania braziliensis]CAJ2471951.1 unnamed protein product [Leishmania braziliensis]CAJ2472466.1 unnamed protein product [Leishmania braziliensis]CBZ14567.1 conserved hypothetical protein [Leishmania braziliensis MHOM/BR/75/M2904]SYZ65511.1 hypothetical_protein [Leishmania braziliensis MHOM/BR/75/M2904]
MLRRTLSCCNRPKGPPGLRPGKEYRLTVPYRSEVTMIRQANFKKFNSNIRELFKKPLEMNNIKAVPRDLGELPRNYVLKLLFFHQPIRLLDLWELCKQHNDVPLDSARHLRLVLKIAKLQKWAYAEKNQTDNLYYYYVHQSRIHEVQQMVRHDEVVKRAQEADSKRQIVRQEEERQAREAQSLDDHIIALQNTLVSNIGHIRAFDPTFVDTKPYVMESGAVNCAWHWEGAVDAATQEASSHAEKNSKL